MPTKPKAPNDRPAVYATYRPDLEELRARGAEYAHPRIQVGHQYGDGDDGARYFWVEFTVEFQVNLKPSSDGTTNNGGHAYGGTVEHLPLESALVVLKTIERVRDKVKLLAADQPDEYFKLIVGLRGAGFKEAVMKQGDSHSIAFLR